MHDPANTAAAFLARGHAHHDREQFDAAFDAYVGALALDPTLADAHAGHAACLIHRGAFDAAAAACTAALRHLPARDAPDARKTRVLALHHRSIARVFTHDEVGALADCADINAIEPRHAPSLRVAGHACVKLGRWADAARWLDAALALEPRSAQALCLRGIAKCHKDTGTECAGSRQVPCADPADATSHDTWTPSNAAIVDLEARARRSVLSCPLARRQHDMSTDNLRARCAGSALHRT
jgi:tetratricopeptide (TPR) repeat protein